MVWRQGVGEGEEEGDGEEGEGDKYTRKDKSELKDNNKKTRETEEKVEEVAGRK